MRRFAVVLALLAACAPNALSADRRVVVVNSEAPLPVKVGDVVRISDKTDPGGTISVNVEGTGKLISTNTVNRVKVDRGWVDALGKEFEVLAESPGQIKITVTLDSKRPGAPVVTKDYRINVGLQKVSTQERVVIQVADDKPVKANVGNIIRVQVSRQSGPGSTSMKIDGPGQLVNRNEITEYGERGGPLVGAHVTEFEVRALEKGKIVISCTMVNERLGRQEVKVFTIHVSDVSAPLDGEQGNLRTFIGPINAVAFSPDGKTLAAAGGRARGIARKDLFLFDAVSGNMKAVIADAGTIRCLAYSPDGKWLATGGEIPRNGLTTALPKLTVRDAASGEEHVAVIDEKESSICDVAFSPDSKRLATVNATGAVELREVPTGKLLATLAKGWKSAGKGEPAGKGKGGAPVLAGSHRVSFSADGQWLAAAANGFAPPGGVGKGSVYLWDLTDLTKEPTVLPGKGRPFRALAITPDSKTVIAAGGGDTRTGTLGGSFGPNADKPGDLILWDLATGKERASWSGHPAMVQALAVSRDGQLLASGDRQRVIVWELATGKVRGIVKSGGVPHRLQFSPDGKLLVEGWDSGNSVPQTGGLKLWEIATLKGSVFEAKDQKLDEEKARLAKVMRPLVGHEYKSGPTGVIKAAVFSPNHELVATAGRDRTVRVWQTATGKEVAVFSFTNVVIETLAFSPDGKLLAGVGGVPGSVTSAVRVWDVATQKEVFDLKGHTGMVRAVSFSPDGRTLLTGSNDKTVRLWDMKTGELKTTLDRGDTMGMVAFAPDGKRIAMAGSRSRSITFWDLAAGKEVMTIATPTTDVTNFVFSPDGAKLVAALKGGFMAWHGLMAWDTRTGQDLAKHTVGGVGVLSFGPDGKTIVFSAGGSAKGTVKSTGAMTLKLLDLSTGTERLLFDGAIGRIHTVVLTANNRLLAVGSLDDAVHLIELPLGK